ncbi:MAG: DUF1573 domain-containing protein [Isosphaeraceae bacterium]
MIVLAGVASLLCYLMVRGVFPPPKLTCDATEFGLGTVEPGGKGVHVFHLKNAGGCPLRIIRMKSTCNCTSAVLSRDVLRPGETAALNVVMSIPERATRTVGHIVVETNDPENPTTEFSLSIDPSPILAISPSTVDLGRIAYGRVAGRVAEVTILCRDPEDLDLRVVDWSKLSPVHAQVVATSPRPSLRVWVDESTPIGPITATVQLRSKSGVAKPLNLSVRGEVFGPVRAEPPRAYVSASERAANGREPVEIISTVEARPLGVRLVAVGAELSPRIDARISLRGGRTFLDLSARQTHRPEGPLPLRGLVRLRCNGTSGCEIVVPVCVINKQTP